jgi:AraC-like DNA-binding protein
MAETCCTADFELDSRYAAFRGAMTDARPHAHVAWQWMAGIGPEPLMVEGPNAERLTGSCLMIPGGAPHRVIGAAPMVALWFDPATIRRQARFAAIRGPAAIHTTSEESAALKRVVGAAPGGDFKRAARQLALTLIGRPPSTPDPVFDETMARLVPDAAPAPAISTIARDLGMPLRSLRARFAETTGTSLRAYRLWTRLVIALRTIANGATLTDAAHEAGFADGAHFSRTFQRQFGLAPVTVLPLLRGGQVTQAG